MTKPSPLQTPRIDYNTHEPIALRLVMQTARCLQCGRASRTPGAEPVVLLRSSDNRRTRSVARSRYPYPIFPDLRREVLELSHDVECCEHCFSRHNASQLDLFPTMPRVIPRQFLPEVATVLAEQKKAEAKKAKRMTLDKFMAGL